MFRAEGSETGSIRVSLRFFEAFIRVLEGDKV